MIKIFSQGGKGRDKRERRSSESKESESGKSAAREKHERRKVELKSTFENLVKTLDNPNFSTIEVASMKEFPRTLYYHSAGDRSTPIQLLCPKGSKDFNRFKMFPEGMTVKTRDIEQGESRVEEEFGKLTMSEDDTVSAVLSLGAFAEDEDDYNVPSPQFARQSSRADTFPIQHSTPRASSFSQSGSDSHTARGTEQRFEPVDRQTGCHDQPEWRVPQPAFHVLRARPPQRPSQGIPDSRQLNFGGGDFETRMSTPSVHHAVPETALRTNANGGQYEFRAPPNPDPNAMFAD